MMIASAAAQRASSERVPPAKVPISTTARGRRSSTISSRARSSSRYCNGEMTTPRQLKVKACSTASRSVSPRLDRRNATLAIEMSIRVHTETTAATHGLSLDEFRAPISLRVRPRGALLRAGARSPSHPPIAGSDPQRIPRERAEAADPENSLAVPALSSRHASPHGAPLRTTVIGIVRPAAESDAGRIGRDVLNLRNGVAALEGELAAKSAAQTPAQALHGFKVDVVPLA